MKVVYNYINKGIVPYKYKKKKKNYIAQLRWKKMPYLWIQTKEVRTTVYLPTTYSYVLN